MNTTLINEPLSETFSGYLMDEQGSYGEPKRLTTTKEVGDFLLENVEKHYELRIVDAADNCVLHVQDQVLLFPLTDEMSANNKWNPALKKFETI